MRILYYKPYFEIGLLISPPYVSWFLGADIFRLNFSHGEHKQKSELVDVIRAVEKKYNHPIAILADLQVS